MNRIKIDLPETFLFATTLRIRVTDLNYGGHVGNDSFLSLIQEARQQFLLSHGYRELSIGGVGLIMADVAIEFKKELNYGDEVKISVTATGFDKLGFDLLYKMEVLQDNGLLLAGKAKTGMMCYDYSLKKKTAVPQEVIAKLAGS
ncbi:MAG: thioesterase [Chitinophagaceae bacterium]|nr:thioesterase family protein [Bacteroidota bacterium]TAJ54649.1 MAG: thioesterase [Chitinophagaceae bacterium]